MDQEIKDDGILFLYLPHISNKLWLPNGPWGGLAHEWSPNYEVLNKFLINEGIELIEYNRDKDAYWSFHIVGKKVK